MLSATSAPSASTAPSSATASVSDANASQDRFMKLLVAQLKNQDPMNPMDNAQMTSQMAQINTVTGIEKVNETLKNMATQFTSLQVLQGASMVGRDVLLEGDRLTPRDGLAGGAIDLAGPADAVKVEILSPAGQVLQTLNLGALGAGRHPFDWDASGYSGSAEPSFRISATLGGKAVASTALARDQVLSVGSDQGAMTVQLQGRGAVAYASIKAIL